jgi:hypothetical protein
VARRGNGIRGSVRVRILRRCESPAYVGRERGRCWGAGRGRNDEPEASSLSPQGESTLNRARRSDGASMKAGGRCYGHPRPDHPFTMPLPATRGKLWLGSVEAVPLRLFPSRWSHMCLRSERSSCAVDCCTATGLWINPSLSHLPLTLPRLEHPSPPPTAPPARHCPATARQACAP